MKASSELRFDMVNTITAQNERNWMVRCFETKRCLGQLLTEFLYHAQGFSTSVFQPIPGASVSK